MATDMTRIVAVECVYDIADGRNNRQVLLVVQEDDPLYGAAVVNLRAEKAAVAQLRGRAPRTIYTRVHASIPAAQLTVGTTAPELTIDLRPAIGPPSPYREHHPAD
jgi:predicted TIM-barrel fold metal-dependent hydrolase